MENDLLTARDYQEAIYTQGACNLSGIVFSFAKVMQKICNEADLGNHGTEWKNKHPICILYATQIAYLTGGKFDHDSYTEAYRICTERQSEVKS